MFVESLVAGFFNQLKTVLLPDFNYLQKDLWSPNMNYEDRLLSYIVKEDVQQQLTSKMWIGLIWSTTVLQIADRTARPLVVANKDLNTLIGEKYFVNHNKVEIQVGAFSSDAYYALKYMENFSIALDRQINIPVVYPAPLGTLGAYTQNIDNITMSEFTHLDRETRGSLVQFSFSFTAIVPMFRLVSTGGIIGTEMTPDGLKPKIYLNYEEEERNGDDDGDGDSLLLTNYYHDHVGPGFIII